MEVLTIISLIYPGTLKGVNYRLTVVRQFFRYAKSEKCEPSFLAFFDNKLIDGFVHKIIQDPLAKAKTKINKLWALRFVFGWLIICEKRGNAMITGGKGTKLLEYYIAIISSHVRTYTSKPRLIPR